jgi:hypothetical protein
MKCPKCGAKLIAKPVPGAKRFPRRIECLEHGWQQEKLRPIRMRAPPSFRRSRNVVGRDPSQPRRGCVCCLEHFVELAQPPACDLFGVGFRTFIVLVGKISGDPSLNRGAEYPRFFSGAPQCGFHDNLLWPYNTFIQRVIWLTGSFCGSRVLGAHM